MAEDAGTGIGLGELLQQHVERVLLGIGAGVSRTSLGIETALIDDAERTVVVMLGMNALDTLGQQGDDVAVTADIVVIGTLAVLGHAAGNEVLNAEGAGTLVGHTVDDK